MNIKILGEINILVTTGSMLQEGLSVNQIIANPPADLQLKGQIND